MKKLYNFTKSLPSLIWCSINQAKVLFIAKWTLCSLLGLVIISCTSVSYNKSDGTRIEYSRFITSIGSIEAKEGNTSIKVIDSKPDAATIATVLQWLSTVAPAGGSK